MTEHTAPFADITGRYMANPLTEDGAADPGTCEPYLGLGSAPRTNTHTSRLLVISDIHGLAEECLHLLHYAAYQPKRDRLYLLGDYFNFGDTGSMAALETVEWLVRQGAVAIKGNQEVNWLKRLAGVKLQPPQEDGLAQDAQWRDFLAGLPLYAYADGYLLVHAGIRPGIPVEAHSEDELVNLREAFHQSPLIPQPTVVFGHTPTFRLGTPGRIYLAPGRIGIDTGAKHGLRMSLVDLTHQLVYSTSTAPDRGDEDFRMEALASL